MELRFYSTSSQDGSIDPYELPLESVRMAACIPTPGQFSAQLDLSKVVASSQAAGDPRDPLVISRSILSRLRPTARTIVAIDEGISAGDRGLIDRPEGEWMIKDVRREYRSPIVQITGHEWLGYTSVNVLTRNWSQNSVDRVATFRQLLTDLTTSGQSMQLDVGSGGSTLVGKGEAKFEAGKTGYSEALSQLAGDDFEYWVTTTLDGPEKVRRSLVLRAPTFRTERLDITVELKATGAPGTAYGWTDTDSVDQQVYDLWAWGAGSGQDQPLARIDQQSDPALMARPAGMPRVSRSWSGSDGLTSAAVRKDGLRALRYMTTRRPITVDVDASLIRPKVGEVYTWRAEPTLSMPDIPTTGTVRCIGWEATPVRGVIHTYTLTLVRED